MEGKSSACDGACVLAGNRCSGLSVVLLACLPLSYVCGAGMPEGYPPQW